MSSHSIEQVPQETQPDGADAIRLALDETLVSKTEALAVDIERLEGKVTAHVQRHLQCVALLRGLVGLVQLHTATGECLAMTANHRYVDAVAWLEAQGEARP